MGSLYDDGKIVLDDDGITLRRYYFPLGQSKRLAYSGIKSVRAMPLRVLRGQFRAWGSTVPRYWFQLDGGRLKKQTMIALDLGRRVHPAITPDDPEKVLAILREHTPSVTESVG